VKLSSSKLREAVRSSPLAQTVTLATKEGLSGAEILEGKRSRNVKKSYVLESDSEEDEEMEDVADEDAEGEDEEVEEDEDMDAEDDGLGDEDAEGDVDMDIPPPPPVIKISKASNGKQTIVAKPPPKTDTKTVGQKEVDMGSDDEELSELDSDIGEDVEEEEAMQTGNEEDAEGEDEEVEDAEEDQELDSDDDTPGGGSRGSTPDLSKLTKRQRAALEEGGSGHLLALPDGMLTRVYQRSTN
jgi:Ino eighty subunit 2